jgi:hypothetical protein
MVFSITKNGHTVLYLFDRVSAKISKNTSSMHCSASVDIRPKSQASFDLNKITVDRTQLSSRVFEMTLASVVSFGQNYSKLV